MSSLVACPMDQENTGTIVSPTITPPWITKSHLRDPHSPCCRPYPPASVVLDSNEVLPEPRISKVAYPSVAPDLRDQSANCCTPLTLRFKRERTPKPDPIAKRTVSMLNGEPLPSIQENKLPSSPLIGKKLLNLQSLEDLMLYPPRNESVTTEPSSLLKGITRVPYRRSKASAVSGYTDRQALANLMLSTQHFQEPTLRMYLNGSVAIKGKIQSGSMMSTPLNLPGLPGSSRYGPIGTHSPLKSRVDPWLSDQSELSSPATIQSTPWDFPSPIFQPSRDDMSR